MHIFSSNYVDLNFDFVIYLNPLYNDYDNDDQDIYHPQYYKHLENELPLKYSYEADNYIDFINHVLFINLHLEKDNDNTNSPDYNPDDNYMDFEYLPPESLTGKQIILVALSNYLKGRIDISLMLNAYHLILLEEAV